eukprot:m.126753 g.126753  ORF g.126753 m.126753 type:complete len:345 (-) comp14525_c0_seq2:1578-2612(-)
MGDWFGNIVSSVSETLSTVGTDLQEFVQTVQTDTSETVTDTVAVLNEKTAEKDGFSLDALTGAVEGVVGTIKSGLREDGSASERRGTHQKDGNSAPVSYDRAEVQLKEVQHSRKTYLDEPADQEAFVTWSEGFDMSLKTEDITKLLSSDDVIRKLHTELVPHKVAYNSFWLRYYFSLHMLKEAENRRDALVRKIGEDDDKDDLEFADWDDAGDDKVSTEEVHESTEGTTSELSDQPKDNVSESVTDVKNNENADVKENTSVSEGSEVSSDNEIVVVQTQDATPSTETGETKSGNHQDPTPVEELQTSNKEEQHSSEIEEKDSEKEKNAGEGDADDDDEDWDKWE